MPVKVLTDHKGLKYFMSTKKLTPRQARWAEFLSEFNFKVTYQTGKKNDKADALTQKPNERPANEENKRQEHRMQVLLPPERIKIQPIKITNKPDKGSVKAKLEEGTKATRNESVGAKHEEPEKETEELRRLHAAEPHAEPPVEHKKGVETEDLNEALEDESDKSLPTLPDRVKKSNRADVLFTKICEYLADPETHDRPNVYLRGRQAENGLLYKDNKLWVAESLRLDVIQEVHDQPAVGHAGVRKTMLLIQQHYFWPRMKQEVDQYIQNCHVCRKAKAPRDQYNGTLKPLPVPERPCVRDQLLTKVVSTGPVTWQQRCQRGTGQSTQYMVT